MQTPSTTDTEARLRRRPALQDALRPTETQPVTRPARRIDPLRALLADAQDRPAAFVTRHRVDARGE